jgi:hypothetical protein
MSSLKSQAAPTFAEHEEALRAALVEVAENSFFAFAVPIESEQFVELVRQPATPDPDAPPVPAGWLVTAVTFDGAFAGRVEVATSEGLAQQLLVAFCGLAPDEPVGPGQLEDSIGELGNQVCGTWLTRACQMRRFDLQPPKVTRHPAPWLPLDPLPAGDHAGEVLVCLNDSPVRLRVHFEPESA